MADYILEFAFENLLLTAAKNVRFQKLLNSPVGGFCADIKITKNHFYFIVKGKQFLLLECLFHMLPEQEKKIFAKYLCESIKQLPAPKINAWSGKKDKLKGFTKKFFDDFIKVVEEEDLAPCIGDLALQFSLSDSTVLEFAKKLTNHKDKVQGLYQEANDTLKAKLLKYLPSAAVALSEKNIELREKAKKSLGLIKKVTNYRHEIRKAFRETLKAAFPRGSLKPGETGTFSLGFKRRTVSLSWLPRAYTIQDESKIFFSIRQEVLPYYNFTLSHSCKTTCVKYLEVKEIKVPEIKQAGGSILVVAKTDYQKLVDWIKNDLVAWIN